MKKAPDIKNHFYKKKKKKKERKKEERKMAIVKPEGRKATVLSRTSAYLPIH